MVLSMVKRQTLHQNGVDMTGKSSKEKKISFKVKACTKSKKFLFCNFGHRKILYTEFDEYKRKDWRFYHTKISNQTINKIINKVKYKAAYA